MMVRPLGLFSCFGVVVMEFYSMVVFDLGGLGLSKKAFVLHVAFVREGMATNLRVSEYLVIIFATLSSVRFSFCLLVLYLCTWSLCSFVLCSYVYFTNKNVKETPFGLFVWLYT